MTMQASTGGDAADPVAAGRRLRAEGRLSEAAELLCRSLGDPAVAVAAMGVYGGVLRDLGQPEAAARLLEPLVRQGAAEATALADYAGVLLDLGRREAAAVAVERALAADPDHPEALMLHGRLRRGAGRLDEAEAALRRSLAADPGRADAQFQLALCRLAAGDLEEGFRLFEARWQCRAFRSAARVLDAPPWDGRPFPGQTLLVYAEQGLGDVLQFVRFAAAARGRGGRVVVEAPAALVRLLGGVPGLGAVVARGAALPPHDWQIAMMSLPHVLGVTLDTVPAYRAALSPEPALVARWSEHLGRRPGRRIGLVWQGNPRTPLDRGRSPPLAAFAPLGAIPGVRLIALQRRDGLDQLDDLPAGLAIERIEPDPDAGPDAFVDTAAIMATLDLVISSDTAPAHLAGALGVPTWVALQADPDWRWLRAGDRTPWYPAMRLFRQPVAGDWASVFQAMAAALVG